jgi:hypothetical protein
VVASRVREAMDYDVTRAGLIYILISVLIGIAALNSGQQLALCCRCRAALRHSGFRRRLGVRFCAALQLDVHLPEHVFAGRPMLARSAPAQHQFLAAFLFRARGSRQAQN